MLLSDFETEDGADTTMSVDNSTVYISGIVGDCQRDWIARRI